MPTYVIRRLLLMFPTLLGITLVVFIVMAAAPGGITAQSMVAGQNLEPQAKKALEDYYNRRYGLDQPAPVQYLRWLNNISPVGFTFDDNNHITGFSLLKGSDLGDSFRYGRPVSDLLQERVPITLLLNVIAIPIIYLVAIVIGTRAATQRGKSFDVGTNIVMLGLWSIPTMLAGVLLIGFFASDQYWHLFPTAGLSRREALDMAFMPHWTRFSDVLLLFMSLVIGMALFIGCGEKLPRRIRAIFMTVLGLTTGAFMAIKLPGEPSLFTAAMLGLGMGGLFLLIGQMQYPPLRQATMGFLGLLTGFIVGLWLMQGEFVRGFLLDRLWHLILPVLCFTYGGFAFLARLTRTSVLENLQADYARTARAKGVAENDVLWHHVFRNSLLPLITVSASLLPGLLAGSVIVESIFSIDGMGKLAVEAVKGRDRELVLSITLISGLLTLIGYLIADLFYALADPRVSYE
ncbi:MAG: ABC transporter permease [Gammaproteobacteria bacterium RBG_16_57_12]|nr:MAG: ABC transporter permease [Gammaproteobacteria bacterium RBG_16_57_12]